jgi:hypothetical protein
MIRLQASSGFTVFVNGTVARSEVLPHVATCCRGQDGHVAEEPQEPRLLRSEVLSSVGRKKGGMIAIPSTKLFKHVQQIYWSFHVYFDIADVSLPGMHRGFFHGPRSQFPKIPHNSCRLIPPRHVGLVSHTGSAFDTFDGLRYSARAPFRSVFLSGETDDFRRDWRDLFEASCRLASL